ncbi:hypothetical protein Ddye_010295 [Dipteronia dyeriana]|uniref:Uncharacterized protein n=1 Tax=Dipteronia dyeriana TaxID=168575 RepID=A0AAD9XDA0_9ROSI|nr:hypothetical protein Ddye_010295 [Dipteronia dyeriana]
MRPEDLGFEAQAKEVEIHKEKVENEEVGLLGVESTDSLEAMGFLQVWRLPGVATFAFCLFFSKLLAYTFLYWLPFYLRHTGVAGKQLSHKNAILSCLLVNAPYSLITTAVAADLCTQDSRKGNSVL